MIVLVATPPDVDADVRVLEAEPSNDEMVRAVAHMPDSAWVARKKGDGWTSGACEDAYGSLFPAGASVDRLVGARRVLGTAGAALWDRQRS